MYVMVTLITEFHCSKSNYCNNHNIILYFEFPHVAIENIIPSSLMVYDIITTLRSI